MSCHESTGGALVIAQEVLVSSSVLTMFESPLAEKRRLDCVEVYLPKRIGFLSKLYRFLRQAVKYRLGGIALDGFSIFEADGVFRGERLWEERTLVIQILFVRPVDASEAFLETKINDLGRELAHRIAPNEEQIWICYFPKSVLVFRGLRSVLRGKEL
jgi:hypothetical protein